jgi:hypothetical protein
MHKQMMKQIYKKISFLSTFQAKADPEHSNERIRRVHCTCSVQYARHRKAKEGQLHAAVAFEVGK